jgi:hypothetical protein
MTVYQSRSVSLLYMKRRNSTTYIPIQIELKHNAKDHVIQLRFGLCGLGDCGLERCVIFFIFHEVGLSKIPGVAGSLGLTKPEVAEWLSRGLNDIETQFSFLRNNVVKAIHEVVV